MAANASPTLPRRAHPRPESLPRMQRWACSIDAHLYADARESGADHRGADSLSKNRATSGCVRRAVPGWSGPMGAVRVARTASRFSAPGIDATTCRARNSLGMVTVMAQRGTSWIVAKWPSSTCCWRDTPSSSTARVSWGSSNRAGGSLKARWPLTPIHSRTRSNGPTGSRAAYASAST